mgnify:CR=1 FL=1
MIIKTITRLTIIIFFMSIINFKNASANYEKIIFDFKVKSINGKEIDLSIYKGKTIIIVNVASKCGFTKQYKDLQELWKRYKNKGLVVIGFPSNQFGAQEPGNDKDIKNFCEVNFNIDFPIVSKTYLFYVVLCRPRAEHCRGCATLLLCVRNIVVGARHYLIRCLCSRDSCGFYCCVRDFRA